MTLGWIGLLLPMIELGAVVRLLSRIDCKKYRMLLAFLVLEAVGQIIDVLSHRSPMATWVLGQPVRMLVRFLVTAEVLRRGCIPMSAAQRWRTGAWVTGLTLIAGCAFGACRLSPLQSFVLFREFFHLMLAATLIGLSVHLRREPIIENPDHWFSRIGMTAAMILLAGAGTFVRNGFGYMIFSRTMHTWRMADRVEYVAMMLVILWMTWGMTKSISSLRPDVADRINGRGAGA